MIAELMRADTIDELEFAKPASPTAQSGIPQNLRRAASWTSPWAPITRRPTASSAWTCNSMASESSD